MYTGVHEAVWLGHMFILAGLYIYTLSVALSHTYHHLLFNIFFQFSDVFFNWILCLQESSQQYVIVITLIETKIVSDHAW